MAILAGILVGAAVGAGIALLAAPRSGEDTRRAIANRGRRVARRGQDAWEDLRYEMRRAMKHRAEWLRDRRAERRRRRSECA